MKQSKLLLPLLMAIVMMAMSPTMAWAISTDSDGYYKIGSATDLSEFRALVNGGSTSINGKLTASFDVSSGAYTPIGISGNAFTGTFDGKGFTITFSGATSSSGDFGLFGYVNGATIKDLKVAGTLSITGSTARSHIGGIVAYLKGASTITGCTFIGTLDAGSSKDCIGGIVGYAENTFSGSITNCFCNGTLKTTSTASDRYIGGILGYFNDESSKKPTIQYNFCDAQFKNGSSNMTGGTKINCIVGWIRNNATNIKYNTCIANGNVTSAMQTSGTDATIDTNTNKAITISVSSNNTTYGTVSKSYVAPTSSAHTMLQATASPSSHYLFDKWTSSSSTSLSTSNPYSVGLTDNVSLYANFKYDSHTITATSDNSNMGTVSGGGTYTHSTTAKITATAKTGYSFDYWMNGSTKSTTNPLSFTVESDQTYTAYFKANQYKITANPNNEKYGTVTGGGTYDYNKPVTLTATPATGYHFVSWSDGTNTYKAGDTNCATNANGENTLSVNVPASNTTYTANFAPNQYTITLKKYNDLNYRCKLYVNGTESTGGTYDYGTKLTLKAVPDTYCHFSTWKNGSTTVSSTAEFTYEVKGDATLTAVCYKTEYTLTLQANNAAMGTVSGGGTCDAYTNVTIKATANDHYHFVNWTKDGAEVSTSATVTNYRVHGNETLVANFAIDTYAITVNSNDESMGTVTGGGTYNYNTQQTITATPKEGYHFVSWNDGNTEASRQITVTGAATYTATFAAHDFSLQITDEAYKKDDATCTEAATYYYLCSHCGAKGTEYYTSTDEKDKALGHDLTTVNAKTATCTEDGNTPHWKCTVCGKLFSDAEGTNETTLEDVTIPSLGEHDFTSQTTTETYLKSAATCTEAATYYYKCSHCDAKGTEYYTSTDEKDKALGHDFTTKTLSETADEGTGLYHYVCANGCETADNEKANIKVIKDYKKNSDGTYNHLELTVTGEGENATYSTTETIALTDDNQFKDVNVKFSTPSAPTYTREMNGYQWGTLVLPFEVNIQGDDCDLYEYRTTIVHDQASDTKTITIGIIEKEVDDDDKESINAGYPAFVRKKDNEATSIKITGIKNEIDLTKMDSPVFNGNMTMIGTYTTVKLTSNDEGKYFVYNTQSYWGLYNASIQLNNRTVTILPFHAYFAIPSKDAKFMIVAEDELTGIDNATLSSPLGELEGASVYNLNGQRISAPHKGVNIINGKKVIVK